MRKYIYLLLEFLDIRAESFILLCSPLHECLKQLIKLLIILVPFKDIVPLLGVLTSTEHHLLNGNSQIGTNILPLKLE